MTTKATLRLCLPVLNQVTVFTKLNSHTSDLLQASTHMVEITWEKSPGPRPHPSGFIFFGQQAHSPAFSLFQTHKVLQGAGIQGRLHQQAPKLWKLDSR